MNKPKFNKGDRASSIDKANGLEIEEENFCDEDEEDFCYNNNICPYCHSDLNFHLSGSLEEPYCDICRMDL